MVGKNAMWRILGRFRRDEKGSVTLQILFFSLLLFGTSALVLDSGSMYTKHTQMQAFTDHMALAAAAELDGQDDAVDRATSAVFGTVGVDNYLSDLATEIGRYEVESIAFYSSMVNEGSSYRPQNDMSSAFTNANLVAVAAAGSHVKSEPTITYHNGNSAEQASNAALYAVIKARNASSPSIAAQFVEAFTGGASATYGANAPYNDAYRQLQISAVSAASLSKLNCADLSNLVLCNPWEDQGSSPLDVDESDPNYSLRGRMLQYFAPNFGTGTRQPQVSPRPGSDSHYPWDVNHQLFTLTSPTADAGGVCATGFAPTLPGESAFDARNRCIMARAQTDTVCWGDGVNPKIEPSHGPDVLRAVNTAFDIWLDPMDQLVTDPNIVPGTGLARAMFFEPDMLASTIYEPADRHGMTDGSGNSVPPPPTMLPADIPEQDGVPDYGSDVSEMIYPRAHYTPGPDYATLFGVYNEGTKSDICHVNTYKSLDTGSANGGECAVDFVGDHFEGNTSTSAAMTSLMEDYWTEMYTVTGSFTANPAQQNPAFCGTPTEALIPGLSDFCAVGSLSPAVDTWYEVYQKERRNIADVATNGGSPNDATAAGHANSAQSRVLSWDTNLPYITDKNDVYVKHEPDEYYALSTLSSIFITGRERRRIRAPMVNCSAVVAAGADQNGQYEVPFEEMRIVDVYLPQPATQFCGIDSVTGNSRTSCPVDSQLETMLHVEVIRNVTDDLQLQRYTAHLVR